MHINNSKHFVNILDTLTITDEEDTLVSFDTPLLTKIPANKAFEIINKKYKILTHLYILMEHYLNKTYFIYNSQYTTKLKELLQIHHSHH